MFVFDCIQKLVGLINYILFEVLKTSCFPRKSKCLMKNIQSQHWSLKRKIVFPKKTKQNKKQTKKKPNNKKKKRKKKNKHKKERFVKQNIVVANHLESAWMSHVTFSRSFCFGYLTKPKVPMSANEVSFNLLLLLLKWRYFNYPFTHRPKKKTHLNV